MATLIGRKNDLSTTLGVSDGTHQEVLIFRSDQTDIYDQEADVLSSPECPTPGVTFHPFFTQLVCNQADPERDPQSINIWYVNTGWALNAGDLSGDAGSSPQPQWGDPPERWYPTLRYGSEFRFVNRDAAKRDLVPAGKLIGQNNVGHILDGDKSEVLYLPINLAEKTIGGFFTAAGEPYTNPGIQIREQIDIIEITRYEKDFVLNGVILTYPNYREKLLGKVNSKTWVGFPPRTVLLDDISAQTVWYGSTAYNQVTYLFKVDLNYPGSEIYETEDDQSANGGYAMTSSHDPIVLHAGYKQIVNKKIKRILDEDDNPLPTQTPIAPLSNWPALADGAEGDAIAGYSLSRGQAYPDDAWGEALVSGHWYNFPFVCQREKSEHDFNQLKLDLELYFPTMFTV